MIDLTPECHACGELADYLDEDGHCPECAEHFDNEDAMREEEWRQAHEYDLDEEAEAEEEWGDD